MKGFFRSKLILVFVTLAMIAAAIIIPLSGSLFPSHAASLAVGPEPKLGLPFPTGTSVMFSDETRVHADNSPIFTDDKTRKVFTPLKGSANVPASLDLILANESGSKASTAAVPLAGGKILAVQRDCHAVLIDYGNGWWSEYYHLADIPQSLFNGVHVNVDTKLGVPILVDPNKTPQNIIKECGTEHSTALHVHFALLNGTLTQTGGKGEFVPISGRILCGREVLSDGHLKGLPVAGSPFPVPQCHKPVEFSGHAASAFATLAGTFFSNSNFIACDTGHVTKHGNSKLPVGANEPINFFGLGNGGGSLQFHMLAAPGPGACFSSSVSKLTGDHTGKVTSISSLNGPIATSTFLLGAALELFAIGGDATSQSSAFCKQEGLAHSSAASSVTGFFPSTAHPFGFYLSGTPLSTHEITGQANQPIFGLPAGYSGFLNEIFASASGDTASATAIAVEIDGPGFQEFIGISHADITCA